MFHNSGWNWGGLGVSGRSALSIRRHPVEFWQDLVLHGIGKSTFQHFPVNWHFNVLEMTLKTFHIVQCLYRTPLWSIPRYLTNIFPEHILQTNKISRIDNLKFSKSKRPGHYYCATSVYLLPSNSFIPGYMFKNVHRFAYAASERHFGQCYLVQVLWDSVKYLLCVSPH